MLRYTVPKSPKLAVIYTRTGPDLYEGFTAEAQEMLCRRYLTQNLIPISHCLHLHCDGAESLLYMKELLYSLPPEVDTLMAARFDCYAINLPELARLSLTFQCRPTWVRSLDLNVPIWRAISTIEPQDFELAEKRYEAFIQSKNGTG